MLAPMIAERYDARDMQGLRITAVRAARLGFAGALAVGLFASAVGYWVLGLFGRGFEVAYVPLLVLVWGYCVTTALGEVGFMLSMTRYQKQAALFVLVGIVVNGIAAVLLIPRLGATGAAIGAVLSLVVWRGLAWRHTVKHLGIDPSIFGRTVATGDVP